MPKPEDNHGFIVSQLAHDTKDNLAVGGKLGPAIHTALNGVRHGQARTTRPTPPCNSLPN